MRFTGAIVAAIAAASTVTDVAAFGIQSNLAVRRSTIEAPSALLMSLNDLESKLLTTEPPAKQSKAAPRKAKTAPPAPVPAPAPEPAVVDKKQKGSKKYVDLGDVPAPKAKAPAPKPAPKPQPTPVRAPPAPVKKQERPNRVKAVPPPPKAQPVAIKSETVKDPNAGPVGVALGAAPLLLAPLVALTAARGALGKTAARRELIQEEIAEKKRAAKAKAAADTSVDAGGVVGALVSLSKPMKWRLGYLLLLLLLLSAT